MYVYTYIHIFIHTYTHSLSLTHSRTQTYTIHTQIQAIIEANPKGCSHLREPLHVFVEYEGAMQLRDKALLKARVSE